MLATIIFTLRWGLRVPMMAALLFLLVSSRYPRKRSLHIIALGGLLYLILGCTLLNLLPTIIFYRLILLLNLLWCLLMALLLSDRRDFSAVFLGLTVDALVDGADALCSLVKGLPHFFGLNLLLKIGVYALVLWVIYQLFRKPFHQFTRHQNQGWLLYSVVPFCYELYALGIILDGRAFGDYTLISLLSSLALIIMLVSYYVSLYMIFRLTWQQHLDAEEKQTIRMNLDSVARYETTMNQVYQSIRTYRHDLRHYITLMRSALDSGQGIQEAQEILERLSEKVNAQQVVHISPKLTANAMAQHYTELCAQEHITFHHALLLPDPLPFDHYDFLVAFCNAMENAINACRDCPPGHPRAIRLESTTLQGQLVLTIANTYAGDLILDPDRHVPTTSRPGHGFGTLSILGFADKYGIQVNYTAKDQWLTMTWVMNL